MTQSGQGEQPSARPAREGIVLPSDGGEPLLPGMTGDQAVPAGGRTWNQQWGPDPSAPAPQPAEGWGPPVNGTQTWAEPGSQQPAAPGPEWGARDASAPDSQGWPTDGHQAPDPHWGTPPAQQGAHAAPQHGGYGTGQHGAHGAPQHGAPQHGAPQHGAHAAHGPQGGGPLPVEGTHQQSYGGGQQSPSYGAQPSAYGNGPAPAYGAPAAPLPPAVGPGALPPAADEGATQYIPPVPAVDEGATQFLPPVAPGALPPEVSAGTAQYPGHAPQGLPGAGAPSPAAHPDAEPTQFIAPVPADPAQTPYGIRPGGPEDRQPPAEFDNLFRADSGAPEEPASTQLLPRFEEPAPYAAHPPYVAHPPQAPGVPGGPGGRAASRRGAAPEGGGGRGGRSRVPLIAAVGIGIVVLGVGAGALLSGGGNDDSGGGSKNVSATAEAPGASASAGADPAKAQAVALDKLLADSNNSRSSVVRAVENVKACNNLGQAAGDLRDAAQQRTGLVTRLSALSVDKLPDHAALTTALTSAWKASAAADNHYASWADQVGGKHGCKDGHARTTGQALAGNEASGTASAQKAKAAGLWNAIASKYGLTRRTPIQL